MQDNEHRVLTCYEGVMCELTYEGNNKTRHSVIVEHSFTASLVLSNFSMDYKNAGRVPWIHIIDGGYYFPADLKENVSRAGVHI